MQSFRKKDSLVFRIQAFEISRDRKTSFFQSAAYISTSKWNFFDFSTVLESSDDATLITYR